VFSDVPELLRIARTLDAWTDELLAYFDTGGVSNDSASPVLRAVDRGLQTAHTPRPADRKSAASTPSPLLRLVRRSSTGYRARCSIGARWPRK
jgi:hypothetical protein